MFRDRIQDKYEELSPRFRTLADFILENTLDVGFLTATELARRVNVDPATVVRFSQEVGYSGYRELSREIKHYINKELALRYQKGSPEAGGKEEHLATLADELSDRVLSFKADTKRIVEVATQLREAQRVFVIGKGESYSLASLWATYLNIVGVEAYPVEADLAKAALMLQDAEPGDVAFALSLGLSPDAEVGYVVATAHERGLKTITVTTSPTLLPARQADINLTVPAKTRSGYPSFDTLVALLSLLWQAVIAMDEKRSHAKVKEVTETLNAMIEQQDKIPPYDLAALLRLWNQD